MYIVEAILTIVIFRGNIAWHRWLKRCSSFGYDVYSCLYIFLFFFTISILKCSVNIIYCILGVSMFISMAWCSVLFCSVLSCLVLMWYDVSCRVVSCRVVSCRVVSCHVLVYETTIDRFNYQSEGRICNSPLKACRVHVCVCVSEWCAWAICLKGTINNYTMISSRIWAHSQRDA